MLSAAVTEYNATAPLPVFELASATRSQRQQQPSLNYSNSNTTVQRSSQGYNNSSGGPSKLTKAAMARRFLLRGRKKTATNTTQEQKIEQVSPLQRIHSVDSPNSVIDNTSSSGTANRKYIKENPSVPTNTKVTLEDVVAVATCVLCYDDMDMIDAQMHPIVCMNFGCTFNCCTTCTETILEQQQNTDGADADTDAMISKQQYKVKCPNCRSDLSRTIFDTALLRLIDRGKHDDHRTLDSAQQMNVALRSDSGLQYEIDLARKRETQFIEEHQKRSDIVPSILSNNSSNTSFQNHTFDTDVDSWYDYDRSKLIDVTLLCGLENIMTWYEQEKVTRYFTSCNTHELGVAAKLLYHTRTKLQQQQQQEHFVLTEEGEDACHERNAVATTIYQLIDAGKRARYRARASNHPVHQHTRHLSIGTTESPSPTTIHRKRPEYYTKLSTQKATQFRKIEHEVRQQTAHIKRYPLPNRLPKYCECRIVIDCNSSDNDNVSASQIVKSLPFRFCNDQWDGSIMDAYTKFIVQRCTTTYDPKKLLRGKNYSGKNLNRPVANSTFVDNYKVHQRRPYDDINVRNILNIENYYVASENRDYDDNDFPTDDARDVSSGTIDTTRQGDTGDDDRVVDDNMEQTPSTKNEPTSRVMIASVVNMAIASMIFPGDVVTHINGIELHDYTVDDIIALICSLFDSEAATTTTTTTSGNHTDDVKVLPPPPPPPSPTPSSPIAQTLSMLDETINLFTSTSSTSMDTDRSHFFAPSSPKPTPEPDLSNKNNTRQKVLQLQFVLNADVAVAKALQLRATAIRWQRQ